MLQDITAVTPLENFRLRVRFEDGVEGEVCLRDLVPFEGIFAPLEEAAFFAQVRVNPELGAIEWPNGADLDPDVLYAHIAGTPLEVEALPPAPSRSLFRAFVGWGFAP